MEIKGLAEKLGLSEDQKEKLNRMRVQTYVMTLNVLRNGGNLHGVNDKETRKRRAANKNARKARRKNR